MASSAMRANLRFMPNCQPARHWSGFPIEQDCWPLGIAQMGWTPRIAVYHFLRDE